MNARRDAGSGEARTISVLEMEPTNSDHKTLALKFYADHEV